jgi:tRNA1Val (adenine37-N6)-methyltransferase
MEVTEGHLLGNAVRYDQPRQGYRTGIEPVLLAAAVPARSDDVVLEAGTGAGAGLLCLAHRIPGVIGLGVERLPEMADLAARNFAANGRDRLSAHCSDITRPEDEAAKQGWSGRFYDHAMANPPWHSDRGTLPEDPIRRAAKMARHEEIASWIQVLSRRLRHRGSLTVILPAAALPAANAAMAAAGCGGGLLFPLWPRLGEASGMFILQARKGSRSTFRLLPGLALHDIGASAYTQAAQAVLRGGAALMLSP